MRRVNFLAGLQLDAADGKDMLRAFVEQPDNVRVQLVNRLAMFGNVHGKAECRIMKEESNLFHAAIFSGPVPSSNHLRLDFP